MTARKALSVNVLWAALASCVFLTACAGWPLGQREVIDAVVIRNETADSLFNVSLQVPRTSMVVATNRILPFSEYSTGFQATKNQREQATLSWSQGGLRFERDIETVVPNDLEPGSAAKVVLRIGDGGQLTSRVEPYSEDE